VNKIMQELSKLKEILKRPIIDGRTDGVTVKEKARAVRRVIEIRKELEKIAGC